MRTTTIILALICTMSTGFAQEVYTVEKQAQELVTQLSDSIFFEGEDKALILETSQELILEIARLEETKQFLSADKYNKLVDFAYNFYMNDVANISHIEKESIVAMLPEFSKASLMNSLSPGMVSQEETHASLFHKKSNKHFL